MEKELVRYIRLYDILFHRADLLNGIRTYDFFCLVGITWRPIIAMIRTIHWTDLKYSGHLQLS